MPPLDNAALLPPKYPHRHSEPSLLRSWGFRRRSPGGDSSTATTAITIPEIAKGPLGLNLLFEPPEPRVDIIFVHGLGGGSRKTWSFKATDESTYWPREWLPSEPGFKHVRTHSFGFDSDWKKLATSTLTIHDFALALLADIQHSQSLKQSGNTPIVFIAHSMGGLIIKKAFLLATRNENYKDIASRIHTMYFLGTPHRGSNTAVYLSAYLSLPLPHGTKSFVKELMPDSQTVHDINYDFRHSCGHLKIFSFFESQPTAGVMIVEKSSAVIGLPNEEEQYLPADHRHVCKYESDQDPGYLILLRKLQSTIEDLLKDYETLYQGEYKTQLSTISKALDNAERPSNDLFATQTPSKYQIGSCEWLTQDKSFLKWMDPDPDELEDIDPLDSKIADFGPRFLWLHGPPGSGKSVATGHTINYLDNKNIDVSYFFFKSGSKTTLARLLLSLAYQMAGSSHEIRQKLLAMISGGGIVNIQDHTMIWNSLFLGCIFKTHFLQPRFWVIDALDECPRDSLTSLIQMFARVNQSIPLKIFFSGQPQDKVKQIFEQEKIDYVALNTGGEESLKDISAYLRSRPKLRRVADSEFLVDQILQKSDGIFLWAALMMDRLDDCYSLEDMESVMKEVPSEMNDLYADIVNKIKNSTNADLAKCILKWVVSAPEPLSVDELKEAVKLDIKRTLVLTGTDLALSQICRNLLTLNSESRVELMHQTVGKYLTSEDSGFYVPKRQAHEDIASVCLAYMNGALFQPRGGRRAHSCPRVEVSIEAFELYACTNFAFHLEHSRSLSVPLFAALQKFWECKMLIWLERIAEWRKLGPIVMCIQGLKQYLGRQLETFTPTDKMIQALKGWILDLTRLVTNFGANLLNSPSSIYSSIPALCPKSSILYQTYTTRMKQKVICSSNEEWDERSSCIVFQSDAKSVASSPNYLAVGLVKGQIRIYDNSTLELVDELQHGGPVRQLAFGNVSGALVSGSPKSIVTWSPERKRLWTKPITGIVFSVCFSPDDSMVFVTVKGELDQLIMAFKANDGTTVGYLQIDDDVSSDSDSDDNTRSHARYIPEVVRMSPLLSLTAVSYRSTHLTIFEVDFRLKKLTQISRFAKEGSEDLALPPQVLDVAFCPTTENRLMAVSYQDGDLVTVELDHHNRASQKNECHIFARVLAASPDGQTLAAGENDGAVSLFIFDTLQLIHRITHHGIIMGIAFASNGLGFYDIRNRLCNFWEPPSLMRRNTLEDESSQVEEMQDDSKHMHVIRTMNQKKTITCMVQAGNDRFVLCGREDGSITVHDTENGNVVLDLKEHKACIRHLAWNSSLQVLCSVDAASRYIATRLSVPKQGHWTKLEQVFEYRSSDTVKQIIIKQSNLAVLVVTESGQGIWEKGSFIPYEISTSNTSDWILHPTDHDRLLLIDKETINIYHWNELKRETPESGIPFALPSDLFTSPTFTSNWSSRLGTNLLVQILHLNDVVKNLFLTLDTSTFQTSAPSVSVASTPRKLFNEAKSVVGIYGSKVFFLTRRGWICSCNLKNITASNHYTRHFFIPPFWRTGNAPMMQIISKNTLVLAYRDDLITLQRFLDIDEKLQFNQVA